jgi:hypothetical protein
MQFFALPASLPRWNCLTEHKPTRYLVEWSESCHFLCFSCSQLQGLSRADSAGPQRLGSSYMYYPYGLQYGHTCTPYVQVHDHDGNAPYAA